MGLEMLTSYICTSKHNFIIMVQIIIHAVNICLLPTNDQSYYNGIMMVEVW